MSRSLLAASGDDSGDISFHAAASLATVPQAAWDHLARGSSIYLSHCWLSSLESHYALSTQYLVGSKYARLVGALPSCLCTGEGFPLYNPFVRFVTGSAGTSYLKSWASRLFGGTR